MTCTKKHAMMRHETAQISGCSRATRGRNIQKEALSKEQTISFKTTYFAAIFHYFYGHYDTFKTKIPPKITAIDHQLYTEFYKNHFNLHCFTGMSFPYLLKYLPSIDSYMKNITNSNGLIK